MSSQNHKGFSLLELSISITIIALLVAAVTAGQSIKHRLELNQIIDGIDNIRAAIATFKENQGSPAHIPGDYSLAVAKLSNGGTTENGNGNGVLETGSPNEELLFWEHLSLDGLIEGSYDGTTNGPGGRPATSIKGGLYGVHNFSQAVVGDATPPNPSTPDPIYITVEKGSAGNGLFTTKEAFDYDSKYDNSDPDTGSIRATDGADAAINDCVTAGGEYNLSNDSNSPCVLHFF